MAATPSYPPDGAKRYEADNQQQEPYVVVSDQSVSEATVVGNMGSGIGDRLDDESYYLDYNVSADRQPDRSGLIWNDEEYYPGARFAAETSAAAVSALLNAAVLVTLLAGTCTRFCGSGSTGGPSRPTQTVYRSLFVNLMLANSLSSVSSWFCNNIFYLASDRLATIDLCTYLVYLAAAFFLSTAFGLASIMTVLGFAVVQYFAICRPLQNMAALSTAKVNCESSSDRLATRVWKAKHNAQCCDA
jgi:hypothetical protein